jgi:hypothetical protein
VKLHIGRLHDAATGSHAAGRERTALAIPTAGAVEEGRLLLETSLGRRGVLERRGCMLRGVGRGRREGGGVRRGSEGTVWRLGQTLGRQRAREGAVGVHKQSGRRTRRFRLDNCAVREGLAEPSSRRITSDVHATPSMLRRLAPCWRGGHRAAMQSSFGGLCAHHVWTARESAGSIFTCRRRGTTDMRARVCD